MSDFNLILVGLYLIITLFIGIFTGRNIKDFKEYTLGKRNFSTVVLSMTVCATLIGGGSSLGTATEVFKFGIIVMFAKFGVSLGSIIIAFYIIPRMQRFMGMITVGEIIGSSYGKKARIITGISGALLCISRMASQMMALGFVFHFLLGVSNEIGVLMGAFLIVIYSSYGGVKSVVYTDVLQFVVLAITVPIVLNLGINHIGGYAQLFSLLPREKIDIFYDHKIFIKYLIVFIYMSLPLMSPPFVQRILMSKNLEDAKVSFIALAAVDFVFTTISGLIGLVAYVLYPTIDSKIAYLGLIGNLLPEGLKGLALIGIMSVIISTADSYLNVVGVSIMHDVLKPLKINLCTKTELKFVRILTFIAGILATIIALYFDNIFELALYTTNFWGPIVVAPLLMTIFGFKTTQWPFLIGAIFGFGMFMIWEYFSLKEITYVYSIIPAIFTNMLTFLAVHYLFNHYGGWERSKTVSIKQKFYYKFPLNIREIYCFLEHSIKQAPIPYNVFIIFMIISYIFPSIIWEEYQGTDVIYFKSIVGIMAIIALLRDIVGDWYYRYESIFWFLLLVISLPFTSVLILYNSAFSSGGLIILTLSILLLSFLVTSSIFVLVLITGIVFAILYLYYFGRIIEYSISDMAWVAYVLTFTISIALLFIRNKEQSEKRKIIAARSIAGVIAHEIKNPLAELDAKLYSFAMHLPHYKSKKLEEDFASIKQVNFNIKQIIEMLLLKLRGGDFLNIEIKKYNALDFVQDCVAKYRIINSIEESSIQVICCKNNNLYCDGELMKYVLFNLINNALYYNDKYQGNVTIILDKLDEEFVIIVRNYGVGIPREKMHLIFYSFFTDKKNGTGLGLYFCKQAMLKMKGDIICNSEEGNKTDFILSFSAIKEGL